MLLLSQAVEKTRNLAIGQNYDRAAAKALRSMGFSNPSITVRVARIVNDIGANEQSSLLSAVTAKLGQEGGFASAALRKQTTQLAICL